MSKGIKVLLLIIFIILPVLFFIGKSKKQNNEVVFWTLQMSDFSTYINGVIRDYEAQNPNIKIKLIHIPQNYFQKIHLLFASGLEPDIVFFNNHNINMYIKAGLLEDISSYFDENSFFPQAVKCFQFKNKTYAIPRDISALVVFYNKDIFRLYNINIPKNINEFEDILKKLTNKNYFAINNEEDSLYWLYYVVAKGGGIISDDKKHIIINTKESLEGLQDYADYINKYHYIPTKAQVGSMTSAQMFINGELAMYLCGRWMVPIFRNSINFDWDIMEFFIKYV